MNYIENALNLARSPPKPHERATGTQADFLKALRILGTTFPDSPRLFDPRQRKRLDMQAVFLCCSRECWEWVFGSPRNVTEHRSSHEGKAFQTWECLCADGMVMCLGHLWDAANNRPQVILARIFLFECCDRVTWTRPIKFWLQHRTDDSVDVDREDL